MVPAMIAATVVITILIVLTISVRLVHSTILAISVATFVVTGTSSCTWLVRASLSITSPFPPFATLSTFSTFPTIRTWGHIDIHIINS